jgi:hypothetical protein
MPQAERGLTVDLLSAPVEAALAQLTARVDLFRLHGLEGRARISCGRWRASRLGMRA